MVNLYAVFDKTAEECGPIFEAKNDGLAVRFFKKKLESVDPGLVEEFQLLQVGTLDHDKCLVESLDIPELVEVTVNTEVEEEV